MLNKCPKIFSLYWLLLHTYRHRKGLTGELGHFEKVIFRLVFFERERGAIIYANLIDFMRQMSLNVD